MPMELFQCIGSPTLLTIPLQGKRVITPGRHSLELLDGGSHKVGGREGSELIQQLLLRSAIDGRQGEGGQCGNEL